MVTSDLNFQKNDMEDEFNSINTPVEGSDYTKILENNNPKSQSKVQNKNNKKSKKGVEIITKDQENEKKMEIPYFSILITSVFIWAGAQVFYDFPQIYSTYLIDYFDVDTVDIRYLYSLYALPNVILSIVGSIALERYGLGFGLTILQVVTVVSLLSCYFSILTQQFIWMLIGRTLFGVGSELLSIGQASVTDL